MDTTGNAPGFVLLLVLLSGVPACLYLWFVWWLDRYDREPLGYVAAAFVWGGTGAVFLGVVLNLAFSLPALVFFGEGGFSLFSTVVGAPVVEEIGKLLIVGVLAFSRRFDGLIDGMVYGAASGLGFAAVENFGYFAGVADRGPEALVAVVILRTGYTMIGHGVATSISGAGIGAAKFSRRGLPARVAMVLGGLGIAMVLHALGNFMMVFSAGTGLALLGLMTVVACLGVLALAMVIMQVELAREAQVIRRELAAEAELLDAHLVELVSSYRLRVLESLTRLLTLRWSGVLRLNRFLAVATSLALRRDQARICPELEGEVRRLREELRVLLGHGPV